MSKPGRAFLVTEHKENTIRSYEPGDDFEKAFVVIDEERARGFRAASEEQAAKALYDASLDLENRRSGADPAESPPWEGLSDRERDDFRFGARAVLGEQ